MYNGVADAALTLTVESCRGYSAYEIAVQHGYQGTEEEWLGAMVAEGNVTVNGKHKDVYGNIELTAQDVYVDADKADTLHARLMGQAQGISQAQAAADAAHAAAGAAQADADALALHKLDRADVANDLRTNQPDKALSASQGVALKALADGKASKQSASIPLPQSGWTETATGYVQTVNAPLVTERCDVVCAHGDGCREAWLDSGVYAAAQAAGTLTFAAEALPDCDLTANVLCIF